MVIYISRSELPTLLKKVGNNKWNKYREKRGLQILLTYKDDVGTTGWLPRYLSYD